MVDFLLRMSAVPGLLTSCLVTTTLGLGTYLLTNRLHARFQSDETMEELGQATSNLMRVVGWLFTLLLSMTLTDVVSERSLTKAAIESEAASIADVHHTLTRFGTAQSNHIQVRLAAYAKSVINDDWPALEQQRLSPATDAALWELEDAILELPAANARHETLRARLVADVDLITDQRMARETRSREEPTWILGVVFLGFLVTMVLFAVYRPKRVIVALLSTYTVFIGVALYMAIAFGAPFQGGYTVDSMPIRYVLNDIEATIGGAVE